jgi:triphosphatase
MTTSARRPSKPRKARALDLPAGASQHDLARAVFVELAAHYTANLRPTRSLLANPERVHQLRVSLRRLRVAVAALRPLLGEARARSLAGEARAQFRALGALRDLDVLLDSPLLSALPPTGRALRARALKERRRAAAARAKAVLARPRAARFARVLTALPNALAPHDAGAHERAAPLLAKRLQRLHRRFEKSASRSEGGTLEALHTLRKDAKRLRYTAELAAPLFPRRARRVTRLAHALEKLQELLGSYVDGALAARTLGAIDRSPAVRDALRAERARAARDLTAELHERAHAVLEVQPFW